MTKFETLESIKSRRSIRSFKPEQISDEELNTILEAGKYAASAMGRQATKMLVIQDKETIEKLSKLNREIMGTTNDPFYGAPTVVMVLADADGNTFVEDGSLVLGNLMLAAYAVGVGSCWIHRAKEESLSEEGRAMLREFGIPDNYIGVGHCILGYPACELPEPKERKADFVVKA